MDTEPLETRRLLAFVFPGDANGDCAVNLDDFARLSAHYNIAHACARTDGDLNGDGAVDLTDFTILSAAFNTSVTPTPLVVTAGGTYHGVFSSVEVRVAGASVTLADSIIYNPTGEGVFTTVGGVNL